LSASSILTLTAEQLAYSTTGLPPVAAVGRELPDSAISYPRPLSRKASPEQPEEALVADARAGLTPAQMVERRLMGMLRTVPLPVSQIMTRPGRRV